MNTSAAPRIARSTLSRKNLETLDGASFVIADGDVDLPCRLKLLTDADRLFVMLNGAVNRTKQSLPVFARWNWGKVLSSHVLSVCDPTLFLDDDLRLGWFVGNLTMDPMHALRRTVETIRVSLGLDASRVAYYGSSGGGFAAMVAAAGLPFGRAVAINPQTEITNYYAGPLADVTKVFADEWTPERCRETYPLRWSALAAVAHARRAGNDLRIFYAQNLLDRSHHVRHFLPFCASFHAPASGGLSDDATILTHVFSSSQGHGSEPPEMVKYLIAHGLPHLFQNVKP